MNHLINILDGFTSAFSWGPSRCAYPSTRGGFHRDQQKLRSDVYKVGSDMKKAVREYGEPVLESRGKKRQG